MSSQTDFQNFPFESFALCTVKQEASLEELLKQLLLWHKDEECLIGFDRSLWVKLSSGFLPPQLYSLDLGDDSLEFSFFLAVNGIEDKLKSLDLFTSSVSIFPSVNIEMTGELKVASYVEEEFIDGRYLACLDVLDDGVEEVSGVRLMTVNNEKSLQQLFLTEEIYELDDVLARNKEKLQEGNYFYIPSVEKLNELPELINDFEKVHLSQNITGIRC